MRYADTDHEGLDYKLMNTEEDDARFIKSFRAVYARLDEMDKSLVKAHKHIFGRQDHTWVGGSENRRFYIWRLDELWILVANKYGVTWEVPPGMTIERAWELWDRYCDIVLNGPHTQMSGTEACHPICGLCETCQS